VLYRLAADAVVVLHLGFVAAAAWGAGIEFLGGVCPLTPIENRLRRLGGEAGYPGGFVDHYLLPALYPSGLTRRIEIALGIAVLLGNAAIYAVVIRRGRRRRAA
jgi:hypothetical protein